MGSQAPIKNWLRKLRWGWKLLNVNASHETINLYKRNKMKKFTFRLLSVSLAALLSFTMLSCGDDDEDLRPTDENVDQPGNTGGSTAKEYTITQLVGYWVNTEQWNNCKTAIREFGNSPQPSSYYLEDSQLNEGVEGYYITADGKAYEIFLTVTTTKYSNNDVAGNKVLKSWSCTDGKTVYFMNITGSKYNHSCTVSGDELTIGWNQKFTILSTSFFRDTYYTKYEKVNLSL